MLARGIILVIGYIFGLFQSGYFYGKLRNIDIRTKGSGNVGATNTLRVFGVKAGILILLCDFLKAFIPCFITGLIFKENIPERATMIMWMGLGVALGHNYPFFLKFRGGKGVASTVGLFFALDWKIGLAMVAVFALIALTTRLVSLASIIMMLAFMVVGLMYLDFGMECNLLVIVISGMSIIRHAANIERLLRGKEKQI